MKTFFFIATLFVFSNALGQYIDFPGKFARILEKNAVKKMEKQTKKTTQEYLKTSPTTLVEKASRSRLSFNSLNSAYINYLNYSSMCNSYLNPFKKRDCTNKFNYLKEAHMKVLILMQVRTTNQINNGVKEQIGEKYTSITNTILKELEQMKHKAEKNIFYRLLSGK